jgi:YVTN family beta-propeller protein
LIEFRILGPLEVLENGRPLDVGGPKVRALLAVLLLHRGEVVSTDRLIDSLWGERASATAAKTVQVYVSNLRKALGDGLLVTRGHGYLLQNEAGQVDADRFATAVLEGRRALDAGDGRVAGERLREALAMWRGPPLADFAYEGFAQGTIARLEAARLEATEDRIDADLAVGELSGLVGELEGLVREHPLRERLQGQLMLALYRSGRQADALERYREARRSLVEELGLEPGEGLQELERAILAHDPALGAPAKAARPPPAAARRGGWLIAAAGAVLLAAIAAAAVKLSGSGVASVRVAPNSVAVIDPHTNRVVAAAPTGTRPGAITFGSGSLWVANIDDQTVSRIDPISLRTLHNFPVDGPPTGLAAGANAIWVAQSNAEASSVSVSAIDPQFNVVRTTKRLVNLVPGGPGSVAAQGNAVWVAPSSGDLTRLDPQTSRVVEHFDPNSGPAAIALGDGAIWTVDTEADNVTRVDPTGLRTQIAVGRGPAGIAVNDRAVWVADSLDDEVKRIDPSTQSVTYTIAVGHSPTGVAVGAGSIWVANSGDGTVTRIDPQTNTGRAIDVGGSPQAITVADGRVWVTVDAQTIKPTDLAAEGGTLRMDSQLGINSTDPPVAAFPVAEQVLYATCAKLVNYPDQSGPAGSRLIPEVAQSLPARSPDGKTYTFTIRSGFRFSPPSNAPVTAQTFKDTIERTLGPRMGGVGPEFSDIVGAAAYGAGKAPHISGILVRGNQLTIHLLAPAPDLPARMTEPGLCAVPSGTPIDPKGALMVSSAGPYYVASFNPGQGVVLKRNPNYGGSRPHRLAQIQIAVGIAHQRGIANVEGGTADYTTLVGPGAANVQALASQLAARYGPGSPAARRGAQQYFVNPQLEVDYFILNTHRPLFANVRMRRAVSYAINRRVLARLGEPYDALPDRPTDHYLPPGIPGYSDARVYPPTPDLAKATALAHGGGRTGVFYSCDIYPCAEQAQILKTEMAAIGVQLTIRTFPILTGWARMSRPGEPFDIAYFGWVLNYADPAGVLPFILDGAGVYPAFDDPVYRRRLAAVGRLTGPERYLRYGKLDLDIARNAAPLLAYGYASNSDFFSARIGCQTYGLYGLDLAALCIKRGSR